MVNNSGLRPLGYAVLVKPYEQEEKTHGGILLPQNKRDQLAMLDQRVVVIAVGPMAWEDETIPRAQPGDKVLVSKMAGHMLQGTADGVQYRMVQDRDIFAGISQEGAEINYV